MTDPAAYDDLGTGYARTRRPDPRLERTLWDALGDAASVVNVGAGAGSYEPPTTVLAVEPSATMLDQRPATAAPAVQAVAEALPLRDGAADAALAVLTLHHWSDWRAGVAELRRVAGRVVVFTWDQPTAMATWPITYWPAIRDLDDGRAVEVDELVAELGGARAGVTVTPWSVPVDCRDGFLTAFWARPARYLDPDVRAGMSAFRQIDPAEVAAGCERLRADLVDGTWHDRYADLLDRGALDCGYRVVVSGGGDPAGSARRPSRR